MIRFLKAFLYACLVVAGSAGEVVSPKDEPRGALEDAATIEEEGAHVGTRDLGDVTVKIDGKWLEFRLAAAGGSVATGCTSGCSTAAGSEPLGTNNSPWRYTTRSCTVLDVVEGYPAGNAYYNVYDNNTFLFTTSVGDENGDSSSNPAVAWSDPDYGKGSKKLQPGTHNIKITTKWMNPAYGSDGGWFRIRTVDCVAPCLSRGNTCAAGGRACCSGLICRRRAVDPATSPTQCRYCVPQGGRCIQRSDCCNNRRCLRDVNNLKKCF